jgi:hypothetical protein
MSPRIKNKRMKTTRRRVRTRKAVFIGKLRSEVDIEIRDRACFNA